MLERALNQSSTKLQNSIQRTGCGRPLMKRISSFSLSVSNIAKELQEHSLTLEELRTKRIGFVCALLCAFLGSVKGWIVSQLAGIGPAEILGLRSVGAVCFLLPIVILRQSKFIFDYRTNLTLILRSLVGNVAVAGYYYGFAYLPLAEASLIFYSTPIYTTLISWLFLGERCGVTQGMALLLCIGGVALVSSPTLISFNGEIGFTQSIQGVLGCLVGALAQSIAIVILRRLDNVTADVISFWWALSGAVVCIGVNGLVGNLVQWTCGYQSTLVVCLAFVGFVSELAMVAALYFEEAGPVSVALTSEILWAFVLETGLQGETPGILTTLGAVLIFLSILVPSVFTACRRRMQTRARIKCRLEYEEIMCGNESIQVLDHQRHSENSALKSP